MLPRLLISSPFNDALDISLSIEYFFNLFPCYLFIIIGICRYFSLYRAQNLSEQDNNTQPEDDESDSLPSTEPTPALTIKQKLSYFMAFLYFLSIALAFLLPESLFWAAGYETQSFWYITGGAAWILSGKLIELEFEKEYSQELYTHQLFCPLTMVISLLNLLLKENLIIDFILHAIKLIIAFILTLYVYVKPNDRLEANESLNSAEIKDEKSRFLYAFLDKFEQLQFIQAIFRYDLNKTPESIPLIEFQSKITERNNSRSSSDRTNSIISQPNNNLLRKIPANREILVKFAIFDEETNLEILNPMYSLNTKLNETTFISNRRFDEILDFYNFISGIYKAKDFPDYSDQFPDFEVSNKPKDIERFLNALISEPAFIHPRFLDFLKVSKFIDRKPFLEYFNSIVPKRSLKLNTYKTLDSINPLSPSLRRNSENNADYKEMDESILPISRINLNSHKLVCFEVTCSGWEKAKDQTHYLFIFQLKCLPNQANWTIKKSCSDVKEFDKSLQESLKRTGNLFNYYVPKKTANFRDMDNAFLEERRKGLERYMKEILADKSCFDELLFNFIDFDIERKLPFDLKEKELDYSLSEDEINHNLLVESSSPIEFHSIKEDNLIYLDEPPGKWGIIKQNDLWSPSFRRRKVVSDINFNNVRIIFNGVKSFLIQQNGGPRNKRSNTINGKMEKNYFLDLQEMEFSGSPHFNTIRTVIKLSKNYKELEEFDRIIRKNFENDDLPDLPDDDEDGNETKKKKKWEEYFTHLIGIRMIEENQTFKDFFHLDRARNRYMYDSDKKETFKLDLTNI